MKLEQQVCSLDLAKRLKELGVKQESLYWWNKSVDLETKMANEDWHVSDNKRDCCNGNHEPTSAFTVAELGEMLPNDIAEYRENSQWNVLSEKYTKGYVGNEADARAKMLCYLLENGLITAETHVG